MDAPKTDTIRIEQQELDRLTDRGFHFVARQRIAKPRTLKQRLLRQQPEAETVETTIEIHQPTLATLDRIAPLMLRLSPRVQSLVGTTEETILNTAKLTLSDSRTLALILAHLALGEDYYLLNPQTNRYTTDDQSLHRLQDTILHSATPSLLIQICQAALAVCNLADFIASIRLLAAETQTSTGRIE